MHAGGRDITYGELDASAERLARNLYDYGLRPLDRVVVQLPNDAPFAYLYLALQKLGAVPIMALPQHRYREIEQFARLSEAAACVVPSCAKDVDFREIVGRVRETVPSVQLAIVNDAASDGFLSLSELLDREPAATAAEIAAIEIDPDDPAVFQLSGGTTGIPKLIPRTHNDYDFTSRLACRCAVSARVTACSTSSRSRTTCRSRARACRVSGSPELAWCCIPAPAARRCSR